MSADVDTPHPPVRAPAAGLTLHRSDSTQMAHRAVEVVRSHLDDGRAPGDVAVLARVASALLPVQVALGAAGISHTSPLDASVLTRTGIRTALAYLRLGCDLERIRRDDLLETINRPARKVKSAVTPLLPRARTTSMNQLESLTASLDPTHRTRFTEYLGDLHTLEGVITAGATTAECLEVIRDRIGLGEAMDALDSSRSRPEGSSHGDDLDALQQLAALQPDPASFASWLAQRLQVPGNPDGVTLSTIHRVKGREWGAVVVFAANQGLLPHRLADDVEEERRVFHVAVTRCRSHVDVIADRARPSPFVAELEPDGAGPHAGAAGDAGAGHPTPEPAAPAGARTVAAPSPPVTPTRPDDSSFVAEVGLAVTLPGGIDARILEVAGPRIRCAVIDPTDAPHGPDVWATLPVPVVVDGEAGRLVVPHAATVTRTGDEADVDEQVFTALRSWRARVAAESGVPAYLVFHDRHLRTIAGRRPQTLRELAACPGVGPAKLERFGDDVLDVVAGDLGGGG